MKENTPALHFFPVGTNEWRFQESPAMQGVTERFDSILERFQGDKKLGGQIKKLLVEHPNHVDALHHYAMHRIDSGHLLDGYVYALAAVTTARAAFPVEFLQGKDRIPYGFVSNRPFHRALNGLMFAHASLGDYTAAIRTANEQLALDSEDRMGVRIVLPIYLLEDGQPEAALKVFAKPQWEEFFGTALYLKALALLSLGRIKQGKTVLAGCLASYPKVARYILEVEAPAPPMNTHFGIERGSEYEGWFYGRQYASLWWKKPEAIDLLRQVSARHADMKVKR